MTADTAPAERGTTETAAKLSALLWCEPSSNSCTGDSGNSVSCAAMNVALGESVADGEKYSEDPIDETVVANDASRIRGL